VGKRKGMVQSRKEKEVNEDKERVCGGLFCLHSGVSSWSTTVMEWP